MNYWEGQLIRLRGIEPEDYEFFYNWNLDTNTQKNLAWIWFPQSKQAVMEWAKQECLKKGVNDEYFFVIETLDQQPVGSINTNQVNKIDGTFRYGIGIIPAARKKGYAQEAIQLLLNYYFNELRYHKVNAGVYAFNESSIALHHKLGFALEGKLREHVFTKGQYWDMLLFGMLRKEFNENASFPL